MLIYSLPASPLRSHLALGIHALTDLPALDIVRLNASPRHRIPVHSASSGPSVTHTSPIRRGNAMKTRRPCAQF
jgi:hypothetical protein